MEKQISRNELLLRLLAIAKNPFTTCEQKFDVRKILENSSNFDGKNHIFLVQCYFSKTSPLFTVTKEEAIYQARLALKEKNLFSCYYLFLLLKDSNPTSARLYLRIAVDEGYPEAYLEIAKCYHYGIVFNQDKEKALDYYKKAALSNNQDGYYGLLYMYSENQEYNKEKQIYKEAISKGFNLPGVVE